MRVRVSRTSSCRVTILERRMSACCERLLVDMRRSASPGCRDSVSRTQPCPAWVSARVAAIAWHWPDAHAGRCEKLANLGGVLDDVQRQAADEDAVRHRVVAVGDRERRSGLGLREDVEGVAYPLAAVHDVSE